MKIAIVYNRDSQRVINLFGMPNREKYGLRSIKRISDALKEGGHQVIALEGDKDLIDRLEEFMPRVMKGERPGMVFNISYGIQGQARYTHVPGMLEMVGIPYVGSGPLAHSLALDKVVAKMIFRQQGLPTPDFAVLDAPDAPMPEMVYPLIVKPKNEAVSFGLKIVNDEAELRAASKIIFDSFQQAVLVESYIDGREINVGLLGNSPPEAFAPVELIFGEGGPRIYTLEDKRHKSGREVTPVCPAELTAAETEAAQDLARKAFKALGCYDCARVDIRRDDAGNLYLLEINSLPSLGQHGSYVVGAAHAGLDFAKLVNRLVEVAASRYFGTPHPPQLSAKSSRPGDLAFGYLTSRRERLERRLKEWSVLSSRTDDALGVRTASGKVAETLQELGMKPQAEFTDDHHLWTFETPAGFADGTLLIATLDVPLAIEVPSPGYRLDPEWIFGEGIGSSRAPLVMLEFALRALRSQRRLRTQKLGVMYYADEGLDCRFSAARIAAAAGQAGRVLVLRPGNPEAAIINQRRGQRKYRLLVEGPARRPGQIGRRPDALAWIAGKLPELVALSSRKEFLSVSTSELRTKAYPMLLPHQVTGTVLVTYLDPKAADAAEAKMRSVLGKELRWELEAISDRPPMRERRAGKRLVSALKKTAGEWEIPLATTSSLWPSVAGLVPASVPVVCGVGPVAANLSTPLEAVQRMSLVQRTLLLTQLLASDESQ